MQRFIMTILLISQRGLSGARHMPTNGRWPESLVPAAYGARRPADGPDDANDRVDGKRRQLANDDGDFIQAGQLAARISVAPLLK